MHYDVLYFMLYSQWFVSYLYFLPVVGVWLVSRSVRDVMFCDFMLRELTYDTEGWWRGVMGGEWVLLLVRGILKYWLKYQVIVFYIKFLPLYDASKRTRADPLQTRQGAVLQN